MEARRTIFLLVIITLMCVFLSVCTPLGNRKTILSYIHGETKHPSSSDQDSQNYFKSQEESIPNHVSLLTSHSMAHRTPLPKGAQLAYNRGGMCVLNYTYGHTTVLIFYWHVWKAGGTSNKKFFEYLVKVGLVDRAFCGKGRELDDLMRWVLTETHMGRADNILETNISSSINNRNISFVLQRNGQTYTCYFYTFIRNPIDKFRSAFFEANWRQAIYYHSQGEIPESVTMLKDPKYRAQKATEVLQKLFLQIDNRSRLLDIHPEVAVDGHYNGLMYFLMTANGFMLPLSYLTLLQYESRFFKEILMGTWLLPTMERLQDPRLTLLDIPKLMRRFEDKGQDLHRGEQVAKKANSMNFTIPKLSEEEVTNEQIRLICEVYWNDYVWFGSVLAGNKESTVCDMKAITAKHKETDYH